MLLTLGKKATILGMDIEKTKKYSFLANVCDHSLLRDKVGYDLGYELGIAPDSASADVWMNGVYQGVYLVTPKTDSYISDDGYLLENDNNREPAISAGGDPSFTLKGLKGSNGSDSDSGNGDNRITVKKIGDNLLLDENGQVDESAANLTAVTKVIQAWTQDAWDAIRSADGYNDKGVYYADYIDLTSSPRCIWCWNTARTMTSAPGATSSSASAPPTPTSSTPCRCGIWTPPWAAPRKTAPCG